MSDKKCPYCLDKEIPNTYGKAHHITIDEDEHEVGTYRLTFIVNDRICGCERSIRIHYCPMCGRKL